MFGKLRGKPVRLEDAPQRLSREDLDQVIVEGPKGPYRPWRFASDGDEIRTDEDGVLVI